MCDTLEDMTAEIERPKTLEERVKMLEETVNVLLEHNVRLDYKVKRLEAIMEANQCHDQE